MLPPVSSFYFAIGTNITSLLQFPQFMFFSVYVVIDFCLFFIFSYNNH